MSKKNETELNETKAWVVTVICNLKFKWLSNHSNRQSASVRTVRAETGELAKLSGFAMVKLHWEQKYGDEGLKGVSANWVYAMDISQGNETKLD